MMPNNEPLTDRREWFARCARPVVLTGLGLLVLRLLRRDRKSACHYPQSHCGGCQLLARCDTRHAAAARASLDQ